MASLRTGVFRLVQREYEDCAKKMTEELEMLRTMYLFRYDDRD
jgi:hypothetical protein